MDILVKALQLILSLSILILVHEAGHFFFAKTFKTRVEKFYLFFDPYFSLFKYKKGDTEYGIGWIPLGGYVKIAGMIDESLDMEAMKTEPQPYEFRAKPAWQRLLIMIGGVLVNVVFAFLLYIMILFVWGEKYLPTQNVKYGIACDSIAINAGLKTGDKIITVDNKKIENFSAIVPFILLNQSKTVEVERDGKQVQVNLPSDLIHQIIKKEKAHVITPRVPFVVSNIQENSPAQRGGIKPGDHLVELNGTELSFSDEFEAQFAKHRNDTISIGLLRGGQKIILKLAPNDKGIIGVRRYVESEEFFEYKHIQYGFFESIPAGLAKGYKEIGDYLKQLKIIFTPKTEAYKSLGGFMAVGDIFPTEFNWQAFWTLTALLSIMLGIINILPIPALDGGHVIFLLWEIVTRKTPSLKVLEYSQYVGMTILLALVVFANGNDIVRFFFK